MKVADEGGRTGGDVIASIFSVLFGAMMLGQTAPGISAISVARGAAVEVFETLDRVPPIDSSSEEGLKPDKVDGQVVFHGVGFSYVSFGPLSKRCAGGAASCAQCCRSWIQARRGTMGRDGTARPSQQQRFSAGSGPCPYVSSEENASGIPCSNFVHKLP